MSYLIQVDDNGRCQDETTRYTLGRVENFEDAVAPPNGWWTSIWCRQWNQE